MSFLNRIFSKEEPEPEGFLELDFERTFPHVFWTSSWCTDDEYPNGFRYNVLSIRIEPAGHFEVVLLHETREGGKTEMKHWSLPAASFGASAEIIGMLEEEFGVTFERVDMSQVRTCEEFEARAKQMGWQVSE
jgi:hypothetical protein